MGVHGGSVAAGSMEEPRMRSRVVVGILVMMLLNQLTVHMNWIIEM